MAFPYQLPTISALSFAAAYTSFVYPSLPLALSSAHGVLRNTLKSFKRLPSAQKPTLLPSLHSALAAYVPLLLFLQSAILDGDALPTGHVLTPSWRTTLSKTSLGQNPPRIVKAGLEYEIFFTLTLWAQVHTLTARSLIHEATSRSKNPEKQQAALNRAINSLLSSTQVFNHLLSLTPPPTSQWPVDLAPPLTSALASLSLASATLLAVFKQDPYPSYLTLTSAEDMDWLYCPPAPPTGVRALLLARISVAASEHAQKALGFLAGTDAVSEDILKYTISLHKVARAKACRFLGIEAEAAGRVGEAIGWLSLAREILGVKETGLGIKGGVAKFKRDREEKKEARALEKGKETWGVDAGRIEEARVLEALEAKWRAVNDKVFFQGVEESRVLAQRVPSGREVHKVGGWEVPVLGREEIEGLKGGASVGVSTEEGSDEKEEVETEGKREAFVRRRF